jgi:hypothetical protein
MPLDLFAGNRVSDFASARAWYERFMGGEPAFMPNDVEAVWALAEHRWLYILEDRERAGHAVNTIMVEDLDARVADIASRGIEPTEREEYDNGARKAIYHDADGNEIGFGGVPA